MKTHMNAELIKLCSSNPQFVKEFVADPAAAYTKHTGDAWPFADVEVKVVANNAKTMHITFPKPPGLLRDDDLSELSGGATLGTAGTSSTFLTTLACASSIGSADPAGIPYLMVDMLDSIDIQIGPEPVNIDGAGSDIV